MVDRGRDGDSDIENDGLMVDAVGVTITNLDGEPLHFTSLYTERNNSLYMFYYQIKVLFNHYYIKYF